MSVTKEGGPFPGVALYASQARKIAYRLSLFAQEIENGRPIGLHAADSSGRFNPDRHRDS
jgi:hypothetical protein